MIKSWCGEEQMAASYYGNHRKIHMVYSCSGNTDEAQPTIIIR
jgi:hypothetical protein